VQAGHRRTDHANQKQIREREKQHKQDTDLAVGELETQAKRLLLQQLDVVADVAEITLESAQHLFHALWAHTKQRTIRNRYGVNKKKATNLKNSIAGSDFFVQTRKIVCLLQICDGSEINVAKVDHQAKTHNPESSRFQSGASPPQWSCCTVANPHPENRRDEPSTTMVRRWHGQYLEQNFMTQFILFDLLDLLYTEVE
jgi:hypothetical protein